MTFFSTHACVILGDYIEFIDTVKNYLSQGTKKIMGAIGKETGPGTLTMLDASKLSEAINNAPDFIKKIMAIIAENVKTKKAVISKEEQTSADLSKISEAMRKTIKGGGIATIDMGDLEKMYAEIYTQHQEAQNLLSTLEGAQLNSWLTRLNELIKKHRANWLEHFKNFTDQIAAGLEKSSGIKASSSEKNEVLLPIKTREEIINDLKNLNLKNFEKMFPKNMEKADIFELRSLWLIGTAAKRSLATEVGKGEQKAYEDACKNERAARKELIGKHQTEYTDIATNLKAMREKAEAIHGLSQELGTQIAVALQTKVVAAPEMEEGPSPE